MVIVVGLVIGNLKTLASRVNISQYLFFNNHGD